MTLTDSRTTRRPGRPRDERATEAILDAARRQLAEVGYGHMSMDSVANLAGVSRATIYRRYRDKADLVTSAIAESIPAHHPGADSSPRDEVVSFLEGLEIRLGGECFEVLASLIAAREDPRAATLHRNRVIAPRLAVLRGLLETALAKGQLDKTADLDLAVEMLVGSVFTRRFAGVPPRPGWAERAAETVFVAMAPRR